MEAAVHTILEQLLMDDVELKELRERGDYDDLPVDPYTIGGLPLPPVRPCRARWLLTAPDTESGLHAVH